ncbi:lipoprotein insertase outer membrane protein LolB [Candidatus Enterovibrio escicola]|nr:lipoprotein insertase outer membrane protein LolB [Candidatus Enterovibrio escacola]
MSRHSRSFFPEKLPVITTFCILSLIGCVTTPTQHTEWLNHQQALLDITKFTTKGKVAFIDQEQRISANFVWKQDGNAVSLRITNFFGATLFKLDTIPKYAILTDHVGQSYVGTNASNLLQRLIGISLPVDAMSHWIKGLPEEKNKFQLSTDNRLEYLSENNSLSNPGWQVKYQSYDVATNRLLPAKIIMNQNHKKVCLVISNWKYTP